MTECVSVDPRPSLISREEDIASNRPILDTDSDKENIDPESQYQSVCQSQCAEYQSESQTNNMVQELDEVSMCLSLSVCLIHSQHSKYV